MNRGEMMEWMRDQQEIAKEGLERMMAIVEGLAPGNVGDLMAVPPVHLLVDPVRAPTPTVPACSNGVVQSFLGSDMRDTVLPNKLRPRGLGVDFSKTTRGAPGGLIPLIPVHSAGVTNEITVQDMRETMKQIEKKVGKIPSYTGKNAEGGKHSYELFRTTFRNAIRGYRGITDMALGGLLRDCIGQEVATSVEQKKGRDEK
jgi:hypothetical protein